MKKLDAFSDVLNPDYYNKPIKIRCIVSGKSLAPYFIPKRIQLMCKSEKGCPCDYKDVTAVDIAAIDESILMFIDVPSHRLGEGIKAALKLPCKAITYDVLEMQTVERVFINQPTGKERNKDGRTRVCYCVNVAIDVNTVYDLEGYTTNDPNTQAATHVFTQAYRMKSDVDSFSISEMRHEMLNEFCLSKPSMLRITERLQDIYDTYAYNVTRIFNRFDLHLSVDVAFRSVTSFYFDKEFVHKGWIDTMIIGDTRCGKGFVAEKLLNYFGLGEVVSADNASYAGLVGGLQQFNKHWVCTWGKIPLNDMGIVVIDEASEIPQADWTKMSRVRSEGIAEITKILTQITNARTRIIFLANPPMKTISNYSYGIQSLQDVVKTPEDIARFDYVLVVAHNEVKVDDINMSKGKIKSMYTEKMEQDLLLWTWSRKPEDIVFTDEATKMIFKVSIELEKLYDFSIPLIQGENIRFKLAKVAIAFAARFYSSHDHGKKLIVESCYVEYAFGFFNTIYKKEASGYFAYSQLRKLSDSITLETGLSTVNEFINSYTRPGMKEAIYSCLLRNNNLTANDLVDHLNLPREQSTEIVSKLLQNNCITKKSSYYVKTPLFTSWLKRRLPGGDFSI